MAPANREATATLVIVTRSASPWMRPLSSGSATLTTRKVPPINRKFQPSPSVASASPVAPEAGCADSKIYRHAIEKDPRPQDPKRAEPCDDMAGEKGRQEHRHDMPLDYCCVGRGAELRDIHHLQRSRCHKIAHQRIAYRTADHADDEDRHAKEDPDRTPAGRRVAWLFNPDPRQHDDRCQLDKGNSEKTPCVKEIRHYIDSSSGDLRPQNCRGQPTGENIGYGFWPHGFGNAVRRRIAIISGNPHSRAKPPCHRHRTAGSWRLPPRCRGKGSKNCLSEHRR